VQVVLRALKKYGMMIADNGSAWYLSGEPDERWNNNDLSTMRNIPGSAFEAVDASSLMIDASSGQAKQPGVSVTVTPGTATVLTGSTQQFTATVQNSVDQTVTWSVNGISGGSSSFGFVDSSGLFTSPGFVPSPPTISVKATSVATPSVNGVASVTVRYAAPAISSVTPSSIPAGSFVLTVGGSGFQTGAVVKLAGSSLATTFVSASELRASGTTATTGSALPVTVLNTDGQISNPYNISVTGSTPVFGEYISIQRHC
jgi:hypothetical protein